jgi:hypothetical protein
MINLMYTGSRSFITLPDAKAKYDLTEAHVLKVNEVTPLHSIIGMGEGWDEVGAKIAYRNNLPYTCIIPNHGYGRYYWAEHSLTGTNRIAMFNELVHGATEVIYLEDLYGPVIRGGDAGVGGKLAYAPGFMVGTHWQMANFLRNEEMVVRCDRAYVYDAGSPGTAHAVERLKAHHKPYKVYPDFLEDLF